MTFRSAALASILACNVVLAGILGAGKAEVRDSYQIALTPDFDFFTFHEHEVVRLTNRTGAPLSKLPLSLYPNSRALAPEGSRNLVVREAKVGGKTAAFEVKGVLLEVTLAPAVPAGSVVELALEADGMLPRMREGDSDMLGQSMEQIGELLGMGGKEGGDYGVLAYGEGILSFGNWYPQLCPFVDGTFRTPEDTSVGDISFAESADYRLTVRVPKGVVVAASGALESETPIDGGLRELVFDLPNGRNVAVEMSRDLEQSHTQSGKVTVSSFYKKGDAEHGQEVLRVAGKCIEVYERSFGPYAFADLDVVEAPLKGGAGGVEFTGLVTCSSGLYGKMESEMAPLLRMLSMLGGTAGADTPKAMPDLAQSMNEMLEFVVAHEIAHQWWNAAVGSDSQRSPFLDEALANFSAIRYFAHAHGEEAAERQREMQLRMTYQLHRAFGGVDQRVDAPASSFPGAIAYSAIVYGKGALFFEELVKRYGEKPVLDSLASYYKGGLFKVRTSHDLEAALEKGIGHGPEVAALWKRWIEEAHGDEDIGEGALGEMLKNNPLTDILGDPALKGKGDPADLQDLGKLLEQMLNGAAAGGDDSAPVEPKP